MVRVSLQRSCKFGVCQGCATNRLQFTFKTRQSVRKRVLTRNFIVEQQKNYEQKESVEDKVTSEIERGLEEYQQLRKSIIRNTQRVGGVLTLYIYLVFNATAAACCMVGSIASYIYVLLLIYDVDKLNRDDVQQWITINEMRESPQKTLMKTISSYQLSLKPRLLVPGTLAIGIWIYNHNAEIPLSVVDEAAVFAGFLSYKGSLVSRLWAELKPKVQEVKSFRPMLRDNEEDKYDFYGNLKKEQEK
eukprot:TRINITY_DN21369_c0_g1_i5.p2 TRINITY_DN21369_c0_g1~~TRINITY_DN21369_c0_g1_i5.p2  ORF type:complete len:269 (-),score=13.88 TRINITY_DN21369_c0_g1_i5:235-972(-)